MKRALLCLLILCCPLAALAWQSASDVPLPDDPLRGRALLERKHCLDCHSLGERAGIGPSLSDGQFGGTFLELGAALLNHAPAMHVNVAAAGIDWPTLDGREAGELISFLYSIDYLGRPGNPESGRRVFRDGACATCHVVGGGAGRVGPDLADLDRFASPLYLAQQIWNHGPSMIESIRARGMAVPTFEANDLADLSAYIRQQSSDRPRERALLAPGNPNTGRQVFAAKGCSRCHGASGRGGSGGPDLADHDLRRSADELAGRMWNHSTGMRRAMLDRGISWPRFDGSELADLVAFLYFIPYADTAGNSAAGEQLFTALSCSNCHGGGSGEGAPDLLGSAAAATPASFVAAMWNGAPEMLRATLAEGLPWPELDAARLRDLQAYLHRESVAAR